MRLLLVTVLAAVLLSLAEGCIARVNKRLLDDQFYIDQRKKGSLVDMEINFRMVNSKRGSMVLSFSYQLDSRIVITNYGWNKYGYAVNVYNDARNTTNGSCSFVNYDGYAIESCAVVITNLWQMLPVRLVYANRIDLQVHSRQSRRLQIVLDQCADHNARSARKH